MNGSYSAMVRGYFDWLRVLATAFATVTSVSPTMLMDWSWSALTQISVLVFLPATLFVLQARPTPMALSNSITSQMTPPAWFGCDCLSIEAPSTMRMNGVPPLLKVEMAFA